MPRALKPCGTPAAARRHRRNGEELCEKCQQAVRDEKANGRQVQRSAAGAAVAAAVDVNAPEVLDPLADAWDSLLIVRATLHSGVAPPQTIPQLTKRRDELVDRIQDLENRKPSEVSVIDELTSRRRERGAKASG